MSRPLRPQGGAEVMDSEKGFFDFWQKYVPTPSGDPAPYMHIASSGENGGGGGTGGEGGSCGGIRLE